MSNIDQNPWLGLNAYSEGSVLYGRDEDIVNLTQLILYSFDAVLYGKSGIGKSSLLNAGILPVIRRKGFLPLYVRLDHRPDAIPYVEQVLTAIGRVGVTIQNIVKPISEEPLLWEVFHCNVFLKDNQRISLLVIFDQFEEIFTLQHNQQVRAEFFEEIADLINNVRPHAVSKSNNASEPFSTHEVESSSVEFDSFDNIDLSLSDAQITEYVDDNNIHILFSLRDDFLSEFEYYTSVIPSLKQHRYGLRPLKDKDAYDIIVKPGKKFLPKDEKDRDKLVNGIIEFSKDRDLRQINTLILSLTCYLLYQKAMKRSDRLLSIDDLHQIGANLLLDFYESLNLHPKERQALEAYLIDSNGRRNAVNIEEIQKDLPSWKSLTNGDKRILQVNSNNRVELVHDLLAQAIYEIRQRRQKKSKSRILRLYLLALVALFFVMSVLSSIFTLNVESSDDQKIPIFNSRKNEIVAKGISCEISNNRMLEAVVYEGGNNISIKNCYNLERIKVLGDVDYIYIQNCPKLRNLQLPDSADIRVISFKDCPNIRYLHLPKNIKEIYSDNDIIFIPSSNIKYENKNGILWDIQQETLKYIPTTKLLAALNNDADKELPFPIRLHHIDSIQYKGIWFKNKHRNARKEQGCFFLDTEEGRIIIGYDNIASRLDLSGLKVEKQAFEDCKTLETVTINSRTLLNDHIFSGCTNLKRIEIIQDSTIKQDYIKNLLICLRELKQPITYKIIGDGPLIKRDDGVILFEDIPVLISAESNKIYETKIKNDTTYLCSRGWIIKYKYSYRYFYGYIIGQPYISDVQRISTLDEGYSLFLDDIGDDYIKYNNFLFLEDSFINGNTTKANKIHSAYIHCRNLTPKQRSWYVPFANTRFIDLSDSVKKEISLTVPWGKLNDFLYGNNKDSFIGFKDLKEASLGLTIYRNLQDTVETTYGYMKSFPGVLYSQCIVAFLFLMLLGYLSFNKIKLSHNPKHAVLRGFIDALGMVVLAFITWVAVYWFCQAWIFGSAFSNVYTIILSTIIGIIAALLVLFLMYKNVLYQFKNIGYKQIAIDFKTIFSRYKIIISISLTVLIFGIVIILQISNQKEIMAETNRFMSLINEEVKSSNTTDTREKAALYALSKYLEQREVSATNVIDAMYSILQEQAHNLGYDKEYLCKENVDVRSFSLNPTGTVLAMSYRNSGSYGIKIWDIKSKTIHKTINMENGVVDMVWRDDTTFVCSNYRNLYYCSINQSKPLCHKNNGRGDHVALIRDTIYWTSRYYSTLYAISEKNNDLSYIGQISFPRIDDKNLHKGNSSYKGNILYESNGALCMYSPQNKVSNILYNTNKTIEWITTGSNGSIITFGTADSTYLMKEINGHREKVARTKEEIGEICYVSFSGQWMITVKDGTAFLIDKELDWNPRQIIAEDIRDYTNDKVLVSPDEKTLYVHEKYNKIRIIRLDTLNQELSQKEMIQRVLQNFELEGYQPTYDEKIKYAPYIRFSN